LYQLGRKLKTMAPSLLKWAGGKRQLLPQLRRFYPPDFNRYIESFLGSGAVFFDLYDAGRLQGHDVVLIDSNPDLIGCYESVRDRTEDVIGELDEHARAHEARGRLHYYEVRDNRFNPLRDQLRRPDGGIQYTPALAAMFLYLNRTGFNGLFRLNASGAFNVPAGRYDRPRISNREQLLAVARALSGARVRLVWGSFESAGAIADSGDFLYCDPPYAPISATASFTAYTASRFDRGDQRRLQELVVSLARRGCHVLVSNSTADEISKLYDIDPVARDAGLRAHRVPARRAINSNAARRGMIEEYLITNMSV
jgi:DNA adenine methylase